MIFDEDAVEDEEVADEEPEAENAAAEAQGLVMKSEPGSDEDPKCPTCNGRTFVAGTDVTTGRESEQAPTVTCPTATTSRCSMALAY